VDVRSLNGRDLRELALIERKARLEVLILAANANWLHYSESFDDGIELLKAADRLSLEGKVSKRRDATYRSGKQCDWIKMKCEAGRAAAIRALPLNAISDRLISSRPDWKG